MDELEDVAPPLPPLPAMAVDGSGAYDVQVTPANEVRRAMLAQLTQAADQALDIQEAIRVALAAVPLRYGLPGYCLLLS